MLFEEFGKIVASDELEGDHGFLGAGLLLGEQECGVDRTLALANRILEDRGVETTLTARHQCLRERLQIFDL